MVWWPVDGMMIFIARGDLVTLDVLKLDTRRAYKEIAAAIVDGYR